MGASSGSDMGERAEEGERADGGDKAEEGERDELGERASLVIVPFGEVMDGERSLSCSASCNSLRPYILKSPIEPLTGGRATMQVKSILISIVTQSAILRDEKTYDSERAKQVTISDSHIHHRQHQSQTEPVYASEPAPAQEPQSP